jgi:ABC-type bacteriocin/lantibiotic exporter with double-glycine peptidase domain
MLHFLLLFIVFVIRCFNDILANISYVSPVHLAIVHDKLILSSSVYLYWAVLLCFGLGLVFEKVGMV